MKRNVFHAAVVLLTSLSPVLGDSGPETLPPIETVKFEPRGGFRVNQQPFFPILLYDAPTDAETIAQLHKFGFNVLTCQPDRCDSLPAQGFYGAIHVAKGKSIESLAGVFLTMGTDSPALNYKRDLLAQVAESNAKITAVIPHRPLMNAIGYWEDEPAGVVAGKGPSTAKYEDLVAALDVSAPYLYPVPYQPIASVGDAVARARAATGGTKPLLPILQIFAWEPKARYPTPAELRCMTFLALVEGAHGIGFYSYGYVSGQPKTTIAAAQPELWNSLQKLNREIAEIGPLLVVGKFANAFALDKPTPAVKFRAIRQESGPLAVLVNSAPTKQEARLVLSPAETSRSFELDSGTKLEFQRGVATIALEPFAVEILRSAK